MKRGWLIVAQVFNILMLFPWFLFLGVSYMLAYSGDLYTNARFLVWAVSAYPIIMIAASIWAWISYRQDSSHAGKIMLIPFAYTLLLDLLVQIGLFG